jgi:tyrosyl-tRNA synthetase
MTRDGDPAARLASAGAVFDVIEHGDLPQGNACALGYPAAYVAETVVYRGGDACVAVVVGRDRRVDEARLARAIGVASVRVVHAADVEAAAGVGPRDLSPFSVDPAVRVLWDDGLRRRPVVVVRSGRQGQSLRIDMRHWARLGVEWADLAAAPAATKPSAYDVLVERGFVDRVTDEARARDLLADPNVASYVGFDPTADSLHVGSLVPIMALVHVQRQGGRVIAIVGGGTALIGDPSGRTEMRQMLTRDDIARNMQGLRRQLALYLTLDDRRHLMLNNADWLADKNYIEFLREVGVYFSVNRMLTAECFRNRMDRGLSFIEFNYMLLQAYDFVVLAERHNCLAQMGGSDQWGNICAGMELGRRMKGLDLAGITFPLLQSASGRKFGKTEAGNVWLDAGRTSPHEFFQFWRNADDLDVERFLGLFTLLPMDAVRDLGVASPGPALNEAKKVLAFAATRLLHGEAAAIEALRTAEALFGGVSRGLLDRLAGLGLLTSDAAATSAGVEVSGLPTIELAASELASAGGLPAVLVNLGLCKTRSEARRMMDQGGVYLNDSPVAAPARALTEADFASGQAMLRVGKKRHGVVKLRSDAGASRG